jgi:hypothetical protein
MKRLTRGRTLSALVALAAFAAPARAQWPAVPRGAAAPDIAPRLEAAVPGPLPLFPATHWWNVDVSAAPVDAGSAAFLDYIDADYGHVLCDGVFKCHGNPREILKSIKTHGYQECVECQRL